MAAPDSPAPSRPDVAPALVRIMSSGRRFITDNAPFADGIKRSTFNQNQLTDNRFILTSINNIFVKY
jgi:hypothetical protein